jgi:dehydrogenase/reductase SDR family protein 7B
MKTNQFNNKVCWITGASSGIGAALALSLNAMGARLILSARNKEKLEIVKADCKYPDQIKILPFDMEESGNLASVVDMAWDLFNGIDDVYLNAGMAVRDMIVHTDMDMIQKVMNINFFSNVLLSKSLLPYMRERGRGCFIVTSSLCGKFGVPKLAAYSASKHALHGFYESLRAEYECEGIKVLMITAGLVRTNITLNALRGNGSSYGKMQESIAAGISPEKCARGIIRAVSRDRYEVLIGGMEKYSVWFKRFFPGLLRMAITKHPMKKLRKIRLLPRASFSTGRLGKMEYGG